MNETIPADWPALKSAPALLEWLRTVPRDLHHAYCSRAAALLGECDSTAGAGAVLRIMAAERRLVAWLARIDKAASVRGPITREALKGVELAERDLSRAFADHVKACSAAAPAARVPAAGAPSAAALIGTKGGTP